MKFSGNKCEGIPQGRKQPGCTETLNGSKSTPASSERDLGFIVGNLLKILSQSSVEVKKRNRNVRNEYRRNKEHNYPSVYFMVY